MTTFYLVRHGEKIREKGDPGLSDIGREQAKHTAVYLSRFPITAVYTSPLLRTKETAHIIGLHLQIPVTLEPLLIERINWELPHQSFEEFVKMWNDATAHPEVTPPFGDSVVTTAQRVKIVLQSLSKVHTGAHVALVTHGGTIRDFLTTFFEEYRQLFASRKMEGIRECSVTKVLHDNNEITISEVAFEEHLL